MMTPCFDLMCNMPSYRDWVDTQSPLEPYRYYRKQLQLLQFRMRRDHWVLKSPFHLFGLRAILQLFPDAIIIQTHRDPARVLPSLCSLFKVMHQLTSDSADPRLLGPMLLGRLAARINDYIEIREQLGNDRFHDIGFRELLSDPVAAVENFQRRFDYPFDDEARRRMQHWLIEHPQHKHGQHHYTLEQFGLTQAMVDSAFDRYRQRFVNYLR